MVVYEGPAFGARGAQMIYIGEMMQAFYTRLEHWGATEIVEAAPTALKKFITGKGNAKKELMAAHTTSRWGHIFRDNNLTDAYGLCQIGRALEGVLEMPKINQTSLQKVLRHVQDTGRAGPPG